MMAGVEHLPNGETRGIDPRKLSEGALRALGHEPKSPLRALRERCLDCCAGSPTQVRCCAAVDCPAWPFRMGANPWRAPATEAQLEARRASGRRGAANINATRADPISRAGKIVATEGGATTLPDAPLLDLMRVPVRGRP